MIFALGQKQQVSISFITRSQLFNHLVEMPPPTPSTWTGPWTFYPSNVYLAVNTITVSRSGASDEIYSNLIPVAITSIDPSSFQSCPWRTGTYRIAAGTIVPYKLTHDLPMSSHSKMTTMILLTVRHKWPIFVIYCALQNGTLIRSHGIALDLKIA
jgi:hypothetical protein